MKLLYLSFALLLLSGALRTQTAPRLVRDINPGRADAYAEGEAVNFRGQVYFTAESATTGRELWKTDGTTGGTAIVRDLLSGPGGSNPQGLTVAGDRLYFAATTPEAGTELYVSDGTRLGTRRVIDLYPGPESGLDDTYVHTFGVLGDVVLFSGQNEEDNRELYRTDGTAGGTRLLVDIEPEFMFSRGSFPRDFHSGEKVAYFTASEPDFERQLYRTDGTAGGTVRITTSGATTFGLFVESLTVRNDSAYFAAFNGANSVDLFAVGPVSPRPRLLIDFPAPGLQIRTFDGNRNRIAFLGDRMIFAADLGDGPELYTSFGTLASTQLLVDKEEFPFITYSPQNFTVRGDELFYTDATPGTGIELWRTDGTPEGTFAVTTMVEGRGPALGRANYLYEHLGSLYFGGQLDGASGERELLWSTGRPGFKQRVGDPNEAIPADPENFVALDGDLLFFASTPGTGRELFRTDGVAPLTATLVATTDVSCPGRGDGTAVVSVSGGRSSVDGTGGRRTITNLGPGLTVLTVSDSSGFSDTVTVRISEPDPLDIVNVAEGPGMNVDSIVLQISGGTPPYSVSWSDDRTLNTQRRTGLAGGVYIATITDANGCQVFRAYQLGSALSAAVVSTTPVSCNGGRDGAAIVNVQGGGTINGGPRRFGNLSAGDTTLVIVDSDSDTVTVTVTITQPEAISIVNDADRPGSLDLFVSGGNPPYTLAWADTSLTTPQRDSLPAGTYVATVSDTSGCSRTTAFTIEGLLSATLLATTDVSCFGGRDGTARLSIRGGTTEADGTDGVRTFDNLAAGDTTLRIADSGGSVVAITVTIDQPNPLTVSNTGELPGTLVATIVGGTAPYTVEWADTTIMDVERDSLASGSYDVTVTDVNGCTTAATFEIGGALSATLLATTNVSCYGAADGAVEIIVRGGTTEADGTSGRRSFENLPPGDTILTITDAAEGEVFVEVSIGQPDSLTVSRLAGEAELINQGTFTLVAGGGTLPYSYAWADTTVTDSVRTDLRAGSYTATVTDANGCMTAVTDSITRTTAVVSFGRRGLVLYPTLAKEWVAISTEGAARVTSALVVDVTGRQVMHRSVRPSSGGRVELAVDRLPAGPYVVRVRLADGSLAVARFIRVR